MKTAASSPSLMFDRIGGLFGGPDSMYTVSGALYWKKFTRAVKARDCPSNEHLYDVVVPNIFSELSPRIL